ncbi:MAG TPA: wax ester/triacylglycerol synthase family O-acyltransferase [Candidatus Kryptonia bacterium]|nr:wax ester/triacylglycerol synthase family O-acyltransferase [Candidatus Kryptonia bacterium]
MATYDRLSALDASFLGIEDESCHMHVGGVLIFDAAPLRLAEGGVDIDRIRRAIHARLHLVPRFRQRLAYIPYERIPIWVDDDKFRLAYHVRHTALPHPGDERVLKRLVGRIMSQPLDRKRPLWEMWVVEGLDGDRFALVSKTHHCMIDGISGADIMSVIMDPSPDADVGTPEPWKPRRLPSNARLVFDEALRRAAQPPTAVRAAYDAIRDPASKLRDIADAAAGVVEAFAPTLSPVSPTPINVEVGPHRRFDWTEMKVADLKAVKNVLGGTLNDVVLAIVSGALRTFFTQRGLDPDELDIRAMVPVSVRSHDQRGHLGNRVTQLTAPLPVRLSDPVARLHAVRETTAGLKESRMALGGEVLTAISEWTVPNLLVQAVRLASRARPYNLIVTNVPGPQIPLYMQGALMRTSYPVVPLFENLALVVGLFSYNGGLYWGVNADWEQLPDLHDFIVAVEAAFEELQAAAHKAAKRHAAASARKRARAARAKAETPAKVAS